jgi:hypothetical protein
MTKIHKIILSIVITVVCVIIFFVGVGIFVIDKEISTLNDSCPVMVESDLRLDKIKRVGTTIELKLTVTNDLSALMAMGTQSILIPQLKAESCKSDFMQDVGLDMHYVYYSNYNEELFDYIITKKFCKNL